MNGEWKIRNIILLDSDCSLIWDDLGPILGNPNMGKSMNIIRRWRCPAGKILIGRISSTPLSMNLSLQGMDKMEMTFKLSTGK